MRNSNFLSSIFVSKADNADSEKKASSGWLRSIIYTVLAFGVAVLSYLVPDILVMMLVAVFSAGAFTVAFLSRPSPLPLLAPAASFVAVFFLSGGNGFAAAACTLYLPLGTVMTFCILKGYERSKTVLVSAVLLAVFAVVFLIAGVIFVKGSFNARTLKECFELFWESFRALVTDVLNAAKDTLKNVYAQSGLSPDYYDAMFGEAYIDVFLTAIKLTVIPIFVFTCELVAFFSTVIVRLLLNVHDMCGEFFKKTNGWLYVASKPTAIVFIIVWFISAVGGEELTVVEYVTCSTVTMAISGGLGLMGLRSVKQWFIKNRGNSFVMIFLLLALFVFFGGLSLALRLIVIIGLVATLTAKAPKEAKA